MRTKNKTYNKYLNYTKRGHVWTENEIIFFRKYINDHLNHNSSIDFDDIYFLIGKISGQQYKITDQQSVKGILWLKNKCFTNSYKIRRNCLFGAFEINVITNFKEFRFVGIQNISPNFYKCFMPIYRCIARNGDFFDYVAYTNGHFEILNRNHSNKSTFKTLINLKIA
jgi:hypothetical protein